MGMKDSRLQSDLLMTAWTSEGGGESLTKLLENERELRSSYVFKSEQQLRLKMLRMCSSWLVPVVIARYGVLSGGRCEV
jgi:hypothetical protein